MASNRRKTGTKRSKRRLQADEGSIPGPSPDPETNLVLADVALRGLSRIARRQVEQRLLAGFGKNRAREILASQTMGRTLANIVLSRVAMRSLPGALIVGGGMVARTMLDRSKRRREARKQAADGEAQTADPKRKA